MKIRFATLLLFSSFYCMSHAQHSSGGESVCVSAFGAIPNDGNDDTSALRKAIAYCRGKENVTLTMPAGVYILRDEQALSLERQVMNGEMGQNPEQVIYTPYYPYARGLDFSGFRNFTLQAENAVLMCEGWMEPISLDSCDNVCLKGITIDYAQKPFSMGTVTAVDKSYFEVQFSEHRAITGTMPLTRMTFWNTETDRMHPDPLYFPKREILENNKVRFHHAIPEHLKGSIASVNHSFHFRPAILIHRSNGVNLEQVTIHSQPGMGIVGFDSKDIRLFRLSIIPASGFYESTNTDATHFASCRGLLEFDQCLFKGQGDDATNVHGYYQTIESATKNKARIEVKAGTYTHAQVADVPAIGDTLELVERKSLKPVREYVVTGVRHAGKETFCDVVLSEDLPTDLSEFFLMNISKLPSLRFCNSIVQSHLARAVLVKTRNVIISGNIFKNSTGTAIHIGAEAAWQEGSHAKNVLIRNNYISGCGLGAGAQGNAAGIAVIIEADDTSSSYLHDNIAIENNYIAGTPLQYGIYIGNAQNIRLKGNKISNCKENLFIHSSNGVSIKE